MSTQKIVEINETGPGLFIKHFEYLANKNSWQYEFAIAKEYDVNAIRDATAVKVSISKSPSVLPGLSVLSTQVRAVEALDSFFKEEGFWYPRILLSDAIRNVLIAHARDLDIRNPAFVVGENAEIRVTASVLAEMGVSNIYLVGQAAQNQEHIRVLSRSHLGIKFFFLPMEELTMQSVSAGIVINSMNLNAHKGLLTDLSYFNYMAPKGYVMDLTLLPLENVLLEEAQKAELRVLHPSLVAAQVTLQWLERIRPQHGMSLSDIEKSWMDFLKENSPSV